MGVREEDRCRAADDEWDTLPFDFGALPSGKNEMKCCKAEKFSQAISRNIKILQELCKKIIRLSTIKSKGNSFDLELDFSAVFPCSAAVRSSRRVHSCDPRTKTDLNASGDPLLECLLCSSGLERERIKLRRNYFVRPSGKHGSAEFIDATKYLGIQHLPIFG